MSKRSLVALIGIIGTILIAIFANGLYTPNSETAINEVKQQVSINPDQPTLLKTDPSPLDQSIIVPTQKITLYFSHSLENVPEMKAILEPQVEGLVVKLSDDKKIATFSSNKGFLVGQKYRLTIHQYAKFVGGKNLDKEYNFEFKTIDYKGV